MAATDPSPYESLDQPPAYLSILSLADARDYLSLRVGFQFGQGKSKKGERLDTFLDQLKQIRHFVERAADPDNWKRSMVCGIFFLGDGFAINIQQLRILIGRCKSSINGSLQQLGCSTEIQSSSVHPELLVKIPPSFRDVNELKKWTIRRHAAPSLDLMAGARFVIPLPPSWTPAIPSPMISPDPLQTPVSGNLPCPVKCRYKYHEMCETAVVQVEGGH
jgi:hypothetical protein